MVLAGFPSLIVVEYEGRRLCVQVLQSLHESVFWISSAAEADVHMQVTHSSNTLYMVVGLAGGCYELEQQKHSIQIYHQLQH